MIAWVDKVLAPYVSMAPDDVIPLLILDSYQCHMMALVVQRIQELGVEVKHIPGGCTSLCQPIDVSFNKPFKDHLRRTWLLWMIAEGVIHGTTSTPTSRMWQRGLPAQWRRLRGKGKLFGMRGGRWGMNGLAEPRRTFKIMRGLILFHY